MKSRPRPAADRMRRSDSHGFLPIAATLWI